jgi:tRNA G18 (ribose-2'-O)-methylase SpoU
MPVSFVAVNFDFDDNIAFLLRTAACYGSYNMYIIGRVPDRTFLNPRSGSLYDYVNIRSFSTPTSFVNYCRDNNIKLVSAELADGSISLFEYKFDTTCKTAIVLGHETLGVPVELLINSDKIYIPMPGKGF